MAETIKTTLEECLVGGKGTVIISDTTERDDLFVISIVPEADTVFEILTVVDPNGTELDARASVNSGGRNLGSMTAGRLYTAGINSYFKNIKLTSGSIACNLHK